MSEPIDLEEFAEGVEDFEQFSAEELASYQADKDFAELITRLYKNEDFKFFVSCYTEAHAINGLHNFASFNQTKRVNFIEKFGARSHFLNFINTALEDGANAEANLSLIEEDTEDK